MAGQTPDEVTGALVVPNPLKEAEELLRLIDEGRIDELRERLAAASREARRRAVRDVLGGEADEHDELQSESQTPPSRISVP